MGNEDLLGLADDREDMALHPSDDRARALRPQTPAASSQSSIPSAVRFNLNGNVRVKLTEHGLKILRAQHASYRAMFKNFGEFSPPKVDEDGWSTFQLWCLMQDFGPHIAMGCPMPFEAEIEIPIPASGIEAATAGETGTGSTEGESPTGEAGDAKTPQNQQDTGHD